MTELPKEWTPVSRYSASTFKEEDRAKEVVEDHFKELLLPQEKEEEEEERDPSPFEVAQSMALPFSRSEPLAVSSIVLEKTPSFEGSETVPLEIASTPPPFTPVYQATRPIVSAPSLSPEVAALFEKMAATMIQMTAKGERETTLSIDNPRSLFYGMRITITEFNTAPQQFNVLIASSDTVLKLLAVHHKSLLEAFEKNPFPFSVERLDMELEDTRTVRSVLDREDKKDDL